MGRTAARREPRLLGRRQRRGQPRRSPRRPTGSATLGVGGRGLRLRRRHRARLGRRADRAHRRRLGHLPDPGPHAGDDRDDRGHPRLASPAAGSGSASASPGRRSPRAGTACGSTSRSPAPASTSTSSAWRWRRETAAPRGRALDAAAAGRARQGAAAHRPPGARPHPALPRRDRPEEPRADRRDRRRLAGHLLRPRARRPSRWTTSRRAGRRPARTWPASTSCRPCRWSSATTCEACAEPLRHYAALYVGGMGSREQNFYNQLAVRMGYERGRRRGPGPLPGPAAPRRGGRGAVRVHRPHLADRPARSASATGCAAYAEAGVTTLSVASYAGSLEERVAALRTLAERLDESGLGTE